MLSSIEHSIERIIVPEVIIQCYSQFNILGSPLDYLLMITHSSYFSIDDDYSCTESFQEIKKISLSVDLNTQLWSYLRYVPL